MIHIVGWWLQCLPVLITFLPRSEMKTFWLLTSQSIASAMESFPSERSRLNEHFLWRHVWRNDAFWWLTDLEIDVRLHPSSVDVCHVQEVLLDVGEETQAQVVIVADAGRSDKPHALREEGHSRKGVRFCDVDVEDLGTECWISVCVVCYLKLVAFELWKRITNVDIRSSNSFKRLWRHDSL